MILRQVVVDTETTGLKVEEGHRIIEIGCVEIINRKLTGKHFHTYLNPEREIEAGAFNVHGLSTQFLQDKPLFISIVKPFLDFIRDAELIIHNAPFDLSFINQELHLLQSGYQTLSEYCRIIDTLMMARQIHVGQRNSLDALCKRYGVDNSKREMHGALLDANLLAQVYLAMTGGQGSFFDILSSETTPLSHTLESALSKQAYQLTVVKADENELAAHTQYLENMKKRGKVIWLENEENPLQ